MCAVWCGGDGGVVSCVCVYVCVCVDEREIEREGESVCNRCDSSSMY